MFELRIFSDLDDLNNLKRGDKIVVGRLFGKKVNIISFPDKELFKEANPYVLAFQYQNNFYSLADIKLLGSIQDVMDINLNNTTYNYTYRTWGHNVEISGRERKIIKYSNRYLLSMQYDCYVFLGFSRLKDGDTILLNAENGNVGKFIVSECVKQRNVSDMYSCKLTLYDFESCRYIEEPIKE